MSPIPPYTPRGGGSTPPPATPSFNVEYDGETNELVMTGADFSDVNNLFLYGVTDQSTDEGYSDFSPLYWNWKLVSAHELRIPRAYEYFFSYNPGHAATFVYAEMWKPGGTAPAYISGGFSPVVVDQMISADPITITVDLDAGNVTATAQDPVDFTGITQVGLFSRTDGQYEFGPSQFTIVDAHTIQITDMQQAGGHAFQAAEFQGSDNRADYTYIGTINTNEPPTIDSYTSPASKRLRITGTNLSQVARVALGFANGTLYASGPLDPLQDQTNQGNGINNITWSDTELQFDSNFIPTGTATAVDLEDGNYTVLLEKLNTNLDPVNGFAPFNAQP